MNSLFGDLSTFSKSPALITENLHELPFSELIQKSTLIAKHIAPRSLVFNLCSNSVSAVSAYFGLMQSGAVQLLLPAQADPDKTARLASIYRPQYYFLPKERNQLIEGTEI